MTGELPHASVYVSLLPVVEACVVVAVPGRVGDTFGGNSYSQFGFLEPMGAQ